jgi:hypothetical protein
VKQTRSFRIALALAFVLNVAGSPMAWAHVLGAAFQGAHAPAAAMAPACHGHEAPAPADHGQGSPSLPCCAGGACTCAAPALGALDVPRAVRLPQPSFSAPVAAVALPSQPIEDTLRPPIS